MTQNALARWRKVTAKNIVMQNMTGSGVDDLSLLVPVVVVVVFFYLLPKLTSFSLTQIATNI